MEDFLKAKKDEEENNKLLEVEDNKMIQEEIRVIQRNECKEVL